MQLSILMTRPVPDAKAADNLERMVAAGALIRDAKPCYYVYRLTAGDRRHTGLAARLACRLRRQPHPQHEHTTPVKETDRVRQIQAVHAQPAR